jgi:NAD(P)-dependent dehydrogenase (short-subunit alcohol dehydrogenase family)
MGSSIAYAVSKAALIHLTRCLAVALAPEVLVNSVAPGFMEGTRMSDNLAPEYQQKARQGALLQQAADKDDVAESVLKPAHELIRRGLDGVQFRMVPQGDLCRILRRSSLTSRSL